MKTSFNLGRVFGIPLRLHYTWFFIFVLVAAWLIASPMSGAYVLWHRIVLGVAATLLLFVSITAHELVHCLVAVKNGIPVKGITLFVFGGVSQIAKEASYPRTEILVAIVGPLASVAVACIFLGASFMLAEPVATVAQWLAYINGLMALFNLTPGFPLVGGCVLRSFVCKRTAKYLRGTRIATLSGRVIGYVIVAGGIIFMFATNQWIGGLWLAFIGWFLETAATISYRQASLQDALRTCTVRDIMIEARYLRLAIAPPETSLERLVQDHILQTGRRSLLVGRDSKFEGIVTVRDVKKISQQRWGTTSVRDIMTPRDELMTAHPQQNAWSLVEQMDTGNTSEVPVLKGEKIIGMVARDNLDQRVRVRTELKM